jgi:7,8-dihydroneopterin aldolase/epimerase/oxygenase|tara:strand:+ start:1216 stop:1644 length:429 start_codon:yes stop_codon:yes gene_type:complete
MLFLKQSDLMTSHTDAITNLLSSYKGVTTLFLEDIVRNVDIGVHDYEIGNPQRVRFDIYVLISGVKNPENDIIEDVLNYEYLLESLEEVLSIGRFSLLESLANHLINSISEPESVKAASVVITKLDILDGDGRLGCSMTKTK